MSLDGTDAIEVVYHLPPGCKSLPLATRLDKKVARELRAAWLHHGSCGALGDGTIEVPSSCRDVRFRVPQSHKVHDRVYPPAYPIDGLGIYVHTGLFAPTDACGPVTWRFISPGGDVVFDGKRRGHRYSVAAEAPGRASFTSVYFSAKPVPAKPGPVTVYAPGIPSWIVETLEAASVAVNARYQALAGDLGFDVPSLVASNVEDGGTRQTKADVAERRMLRIGFRNFANASESDSTRTFLRGLIAHEFAHVLHPTLGAPDAAWLAEGGADFLRWITLYRLGWRDAEQSAADLADNFNRCIEAAGDRPWRAVPERKYGRMPYTCGLALHVLALASRQGAASPEDTLMLFYRAAHNNPAATPAQWLECGRQLACEPRALPALLDNDVPFGPALMTMAKSAGIGTMDESPPDSGTLVRLRGQTFAAIMASDCGGNYSFNTPEAQVNVLPIDGCRTLRGNQVIVGFAGVRFDDTDRDALAAARAQCKHTGSVSLMIAEGDPVTITCPESLPNPSLRIAIDATSLFAHLDRRDMSR